MAENADHPQSSGRDDQGGPPPTPRWVRYLVVALIALSGLAILAMLVIGGEHGPGRHSGAGETLAPGGPTVTTASR